MQRAATGLVLALGLVGGVFFLPPVVWLVLMGLFALVCAAELAQLLQASAPGSPTLVLPPLVLVTMTTMLYGDRLVDKNDVGLLAIVVVVLPAIVGLLTGRPERAWPAAPWFSFGALYCAVPAVAMFRLREESGPWLVLLLLGIVGVGDTAAYYVGKNFGRRKMAPALSPKKTWAGSVGGVVAAMAFAAAWSWFRLGAQEVALLALAAVTQATGQCGDLLESAIKRTSGVKDSGTLLPGHGGFLDRADATMLAAPVFVLGVRVFGTHWA